ncbi:MAG: MBOAT family O-acyltransferase [Bacteroidota bacterium]
MVFSSNVFLYFFLPIVLTLYYLSPKRAKTFTLFIASLVFYAWGEGALVLIMMTSAVVDYSCGLLIEKGRKKLGLFISILTNLSLLGFFKYFNFTFENFNGFISMLGYEGTYFDSLPEIALPIGISFYTFQTMSYTIDVYRGNVKANHNFIDFAAYVTMFPQLIAGPIVRYIDINEQLRNKKISLKNFTQGVERFIIGLAKKVIIANSFASIADTLFAENYDTLSTPLIWLAIVSYAFQIYFDFSGYSDMAIGLGRMFGFNFLENFNYPYISRSIKDFWRRWHISLSSWFKDYVYISVGGNRRGKLRTYFNLFLVFFVTGLWHGASWNFVVWGLFHGVFIVIERIGFDAILNRLWRPFQHIYTLLVVLVGWMFFRVEDLQLAWYYITRMFYYTEGDAILSSSLAFFQFNRGTLFFLVLATVLSTPIYGYLNERLSRYKIPLLRPLFIFALFLWSIIYIGSESYNPFIYFRF